MAPTAEKGTMGSPGSILQSLLKRLLILKVWVIACQIEKGGYTFQLGELPMHSLRRGEDGHHVQESEKM